MLCDHCTSATSGTQACLHVHVSSMVHTICEQSTPPHAQYSVGAAARPTRCGAANTQHSPVEARYWAEARLAARPRRRRGALQPAAFMFVAVVAGFFGQWSCHSSFRLLRVNCYCHRFSCGYIHLITLALPFLEVHGILLMSGFLGALQYMEQWCGINSNCWSTVFILQLVSGLVTVS